MDGAPQPPLFATCPKCGHQRQADEQSLDPGLCPACGLVFAKWIRRGSFVPAIQRATEEEEAPIPGFRDRLLTVPEEMDATAWWGRLILLGLLTFWSWRLAGYDYSNGEMGSSFMHAILLPIHEAGHVLFIPLGEFMTIAGGSLFQWLLPLGCAAAFLVQNRDPFGAAIGLWWSGTSLLDLAPYIYDAKAPQLVLLGGHTGEDGPHDWIYLLDQFGRVNQSPTYGALAYGLGVAVMVLGLGWAGLLLYRQHYRHMGRSTAKTTIK